MPPKCLITSDGRCDVADKAFSAAINNAVTLTFGFNFAIATVAHKTAAAPAISLFIPTIVSYGRLSDIPPVSKVIPFPTKTTCGQLLDPFGA